MNIKRYIAKDAQEAMIKIRSELGVDAVILHTRRIRAPGIKGFFKKPLVEVVAAIENENDNRKQPTPIRGKIAEVKPIEVIKQAEVPENRVRDLELEALKAQVGSIQESLSILVNKSLMENTKTNFTDTLEKNEEIISKVVIKDEKFTDYKEVIYEKLVARDVHPIVAKRVIELVGNKIAIIEENSSEIDNVLKEVIKECLGTPSVIEHSVSAQKIFLFVGPTGVGKTTTLAKLAARLALLDNKSVALVTADTYRIAAVDQLRTYSEILGIPLSVIYEVEEVDDVLTKYSDKEYILVDTAGRSHKHHDFSKDTQEIINAFGNPEVFLVISLTTGYKDIIGIMESYSFIDEYRIIFTKLDESDSISNILNVKVNSGMPLSYFTIGQSVPDDIEIADLNRVVEHIVGDYNDRSSV